MNTITRSTKVFFQLLRKDFYAQKHNIKTYLINYSLIYSLLYAFANAYLQPLLYFTENPLHMGTMLFLGNMLIATLVFSHKLIVPFLYDFEQERLVDYQITLLPPGLVVIERIIFASSLSFLVLFFYFPVARILFSPYFVITNLSWPLFMLILYLGCILCSSYHVFIACFLKRSQSLVYVWRIINNILFLLGGTWLPWAVIHMYSPLLGGIALLNPFLYITEGIRQATLGSPEFLPLHWCIFGLLTGTILFTVTALYFFKKKMDHI